MNFPPYPRWRGRFADGVGLKTPIGLRLAKTRIDVGTEFAGLVGYGLFADWG